MKKRSLNQQGFLLSMKKRRKNIVKKSHRIKFMIGCCFRFCRGWRTMIQIRKRRNRNTSKRNNNQIGFRENIYQGEEVNIPEELLIEVLSRVPLKIRARFKCVSKQWERLISNDVTLANAPKVLFSSSSDLGFCFLTMDNETYVESLSMPIERHLSLDQVVEVRSSCNGLVLIQIDNDLYLWNPLTSFFRKVLTIGGFDPEPYTMDLCFCSVNDQYKVVVQVYGPDDLEFHVATCGEQNWEAIENVNLEYVDQGPFFKGYRHWIGEKYSTLGRIIYFDPSMNKLIDVATPQPKEGVDHVYEYLGVWDGCLSITRTDVLDEYYEINVELLVMKEYGNGNSWEVMLVFSDTRVYGRLELLNPLFRTKKGELLVGKDTRTSGFSFSVYDDHGNFVKDLWNYKPRFDSFNVVYYDESWSSPTDIKSCD